MCCTLALGRVELRRQNRGGAAARVQVGLPEEARRNRAPGLPRVTDGPQRQLARALGEAHAFGGAELQPEIAGGPDIRPAEREDQIDFGAPPPDALEAN